MFDDYERRRLLREIHGGYVDNWYDEIPEEDVGDDLMKFIDNEVWQDSDTGKWVFKDREFSREGQARKAARLYFRKKKS